MADHRSQALSPATLTLQALSNELASVNDWHSLGVNLGLQGHQLRGIGQSYCNESSRCKTEMLDLWLRSAMNRTWETVVSALYQMHERVVADGLLKKYCSSTTTDASKEQDTVHSEDCDFVDDSHLSGDETDPAYGFRCGCGKCDLATYLKKGCPSSLEDTEFPYLFCKKLSMSEFRLLKLKLMRASRNIVRKFASIERNTISMLKEKKVPLDEVKNYVLTMGVMYESVYKGRPLLLEERDKIEKVQEFGSLFLILRGYYSWFSFSIIEALREDFLFPANTGNDERLNTYKIEFHDYCRHRVFECPKSMFGDPHSEGFKPLIVKVDDDFNMYNLNCVVEFQSSISEILGLSKHALQLCSVTDGCVTVVFRFPSWLADVIKPSCKQQQMLMDIGVKQLKVATRILYEDENYSLSQQQQQAMEVTEEEQHIIQGASGEQSRCEQEECTTVAMEMDISRIPIQQSTPMYILETGSENTDPFQQKCSDSLYRLSSHKPRKPLSSVSSLLNFSSEMSPRRLSSMTPPLPSQKQRSQSFSTLYSSKQCSRSSSSRSSKRCSLSSCSPCNSRQSSFSSHSLKRLSQSSFSMHRFKQHSPTSSVVIPWNVDLGATAFEMSMDQNNLSPLVMKLFMACQHGLLGQVRHLLKTVNVNVADTDGATPLYFACQRGSFPLVEYLITAKADVNHSKKNGATPLGIACQKGHLPVVKHLIAVEADVNQQMKDGATPLYIACQEGHLPVVKHLIAAKADVNCPREDGVTPLSVACQKGFLAVVEHLILGKADVNTPKEDGVTPLMKASHNGHSSVVRVLLQKGATINTCSRLGSTALLLAVDQEHEHIVEQLLQAKADLNVQRKGTQETALMIAARKENIGMVRKLIQYGASVSLTNKDGCTAFDIAKAQGHMNVCQELQHKSPYEQLHNISYTTAS